MKRNLFKVRQVLAILVLVTLGLAGPAKAQDFSLSVYGGRMTGENWEDTLSQDIDFREASIADSAKSDEETCADNREDIKFPDHI